MARHIRITGSKKKKRETRALSFTVIYLPVPQEDTNTSNRVKAASRDDTLRKNSEAKNGYQVIVPLMPGLVTYGRTLQEAQEMAKDAIECHIEGLKKAGEPIPNERLACGV